MELDGTPEAGIISYEEYYPYGDSAYIAGKKVNGEIGQEVKDKRFRYSGKERDDETGLYYYGARYYASWLGRWLSCDPEAISFREFAYAFAANSPVVFDDPNGRSAQKMDDVEKAIVGLENVNKDFIQELENLKRLKEGVSDLSRRLQSTESRIPLAEEPSLAEQYARKIRESERRLIKLEKQHNARLKALRKAQEKISNFDDYNRVSQRVATVLKDFRRQAANLLDEIRFYEKLALSYKPRSNPGSGGASGAPNSTKHAGARSVTTESGGSGASRYKAGAGGARNAAKGVAKRFLMYLPFIEVGYILIEERQKSDPNKEDVQEAEKLTTGALRELGYASITDWKVAEAIRLGCQGCVSIDCRTAKPELRVDYGMVELFLREYYRQHPSPSVPVIGPSR
jgi:RHS repeat-associated protein